MKYYNKIFILYVIMATSSSLFCQEGALELQEKIILSDIDATVKSLYGISGFAHYLLNYTGPLLEKESLLAGNFIAKSNDPVLFSPVYEQRYTTDFNLLDLKRSFISARKSHCIVIEQKGEKLFKCQFQLEKGKICGILVKNFRGHLNCHSPFKPYVCNNCLKSYSNSSDISNHVKKCFSIAKATKKDFEFIQYSQ